MDTWLAYAPVKNNPEDAAKVDLFSSVNLVRKCSCIVC